VGDERDFEDTVLPCDFTAKVVIKNVGIEDDSRDRWAWLLQIRFCVQPYLARKARAGNMAGWTSQQTL